ncbi:MAG: DUF4178 domain-containing protein [Desulfovibrio sp.]|nr:DUF4178 domain-containing protein [Desulfovibrio sp.]MCA1987011.1 DUF4178 domain-containing protein [Desulfovibrio sp.]
MSLFSRILKTVGVGGAEAPGPGPGPENGPDALPCRAGMALATLLPGDTLEYALATWRVTALHRYDFKEYQAREWQLESAAGTRWLGQEEGDEAYWSLSQPLPLTALGTAQRASIRARIRKTGDPPDTLEHGGQRYLLEDMAAGHWYKDCQDPPQPFLRWHYVREDGEQFLTMTQWGEDEFEAAAGQQVHPWQFTNLTPGEGRGAHQDP